MCGSKASKDSKKDRFMFELMSIASKYSENIIFTGYIANEELPVLYQISDIQVVPSRWGDPLGNVVIEGMASGIKQVVTNDGGIPELAKYSDAYVIEKENLQEELNQIITKIVKNKDYKKGKIENRNFQKFSQIEYSKNILKIIKNE